MTNLYSRIVCENQQTDLYYGYFQGRLFSILDFIHEYEIAYSGLAPDSSFEVSSSCLSLL